MQHRNHRVFFVKFTQSGGGTEIEHKKGEMRNKKPKKNGFLSSEKKTRKKNGIFAFLSVFFGNL